MGSPTAIPFVKMHGIGNDYVYLDAFGHPSLEKRRDLAALARSMSNRHEGIGSDGLILVCQPTEAGRAGGAQVRMRMFNADGSESAMCGNGVRCVAKFACDRLGFDAELLRVETGRGVLPITCVAGEDGRVERATVDMGEPILELQAAGVRGLEAKANSAGKPVVVPIDDLALQGVVVGMGNPHVVFFLEKDGSGPNARLGIMGRNSDGSPLLDVLSVPVAKWGPRLCHHMMFTDQANVHFAQVGGKKSVTVRTWERGSGQTRACGTGACAVAVAGVLTGRLGREVNVSLPGGVLKVRWDESTNHVFMTGPAAEVYSGTWVVGDPAPLLDVPTLKTERLVLRQSTHADAVAMAAAANDRRVSDMLLTMPFPYGLIDAHGWISKCRLAHTHGEFTSWVIALAGTGEFVGGIGLHAGKAPHRHAEVGYWIGVQHWGNGYATEALGAVMRYAFTLREPAFDSLFAHHFPANGVSGRVMEKAGMVKEATCRAFHRKKDAASDVVRFALSREEWRSRQGGGGEP